MITVIIFIYIKELCSNVIKGISYQVYILATSYVNLVQF
jgi:hypothetical protein